MKKYYLHNGSQQQGPFNKEELIAKKINKNTEVWYEGSADWVEAGKVEDLKELFYSIQAPPIPSKNKNIDTTKKTSSWKSIFIKTLVTCALIFGGFALFSEYNDSYEDKNNSYSKDSYEDKKLSIAEIEQSNPLNFIRVTGNYNENFFGGKLIIKGSISNTATVTTYKDAVIKVTFLTKTKTVLGSEKYTIYETLSPNHSKEFQLKVKNYNNVNSISIDLVSAKLF